jgi:predicted metalloendopeptidase
VSWIKDSSSRLKILEAMNNLTFQMGYNQTILSSAMIKINEIYQTVTLFPNAYHFAWNLQQLQAASTYRYTVDQAETIKLLFALKYMTIVNAFYLPGTNHVGVSTGWLQPPLYHQRLPEIFNYAGTGWVIGHEIGHGLYNYIVDGKTTSLSFFNLT